MTDRFNTIAGWALFAGIIALGLSILSGMYFNADRPHHPEVEGYAIEAAEEEGGAEEGPSLAMLLQDGSASAGENVFAKCTACHTIDQGGATGIGPNLYGVVGTAIGQHAPGFAYSSDLAGHGGTWSYENLDAWLQSPRGFAAGTKMSFAGLSKPEDRANVILYLLEHGGGPALPEVIEEEPEAAEGDDIESIDPDGVEEAGALAQDAPVAENPGDPEAQTVPGE